MSHDENSALSQQIAELATDVREIKTLLTGGMSMGESGSGLIAEFRCLRSDVDDLENRATTLEEKQEASDRRETYRVGWAAGAAVVVVLAWQAIQFFFNLK